MKVSLVVQEKKFLYKQSRSYATVATCGNSWYFMKHVRLVIVRLCFFFNAICKKTVGSSQLKGMQEDVVVTLCLLEKYVPPSFFTIMVHLVVHLIREIELCGPVHLRWMYPFERYMKVLKNYV